MPSVSITWRAVGDARTCPICLAVNGYTWTFMNMVPESLVHPTYGEIWNVSTGSLAHEHKQFGKKYGLLSNCRCHIEPTFDLKDLLESVKKLRDGLKLQMESSTGTIKAEEVTT
jgi:uncharacterized protein with gpF-like domain